MHILVTLAMLAATTSSALAQDAASELAEMNDRFNSGIATQDVAGLMELYGQEVMWIAPGTPMSWNGQAEAKQLFNYMTGHQADVTHDIDHLFVSDDETLAVMIGDVRANVESIGLKGEGTYLYVLDKKEGDWKIVGDMWNQLPNEGQ
ncbi:hypothetical protein NBRC116601_34920 [Cognatishimia sp. WU-CL00825]|uniref:YybH family protein n=1 Tax=Cognatishimia sp. WU-CL00825 TaxID=3127658 RepID=UPI003103027F